MAVSVIPFIVVQLPQILNIKSGRHLVVLISLIVSVSLLIGYCLYQVLANSILIIRQVTFLFLVAYLDIFTTYKSIISFLLPFKLLVQVFQPWVQRRRLAYAKHKHVISGVLMHLKKRSLGKLATEDGKPNIEILEK